MSKVIIKTTLGDIKVTLSPDKAPITCANFLSYVDDKFYNHTIFHRVIKGFMIQGGGMTSDLKPKPNKDPIKNEANNGLLNKRGTLAMARTSSVNSATSQFFINDSDNDFLNFKNETPQGFGYCVFAKVTEGMDVVDKIAASKTTMKHGYDDVPVTTVEIISITRE
jgi:peptidyl-prolyl cis-trans isomerase B (cyclophilin B)